MKDEKKQTDPKRNDKEKEGFKSAPKKGQDQNKSGSKAPSGGSPRR